MSQIVCPGCSDELQPGEELCDKCCEEVVARAEFVRHPETAQRIEQLESWVPAGVEAGEKSDTDDADLPADAQREND